MVDSGDGIVFPTRGESPNEMDGRPDSEDRFLGGSRPKSGFMRAGMDGEPDMVYFEAPPHTPQPPGPRSSRSTPQPPGYEARQDWETQEGHMAYEAQQGYYSQQLEPELVDYRQQDQAPVQTSQQSEAVTWRGTDAAEASDPDPEEPRGRMISHDSLWRGTDAAEASDPDPEEPRGRMMSHDSLTSAEMVPETPRAREKAGRRSLIMSSSHSQILSAMPGLDEEEPLSAPESAPVPKDNERLVRRTSFFKPPVEDNQDDGDGGWGEQFSTWKPPVDDKQFPSTTDLHMAFNQMRTDDTAFNQIRTDNHPDDDEPSIEREVMLHALATNDAVRATLLMPTADEPLPAAFTDTMDIMNADSRREVTLGDFMAYFGYTQEANVVDFLAPNEFVSSEAEANMWNNMLQGAREEDLEDLVVGSPKWTATESVGSAPPEADFWNQMSAGAHNDAEETQQLKERGESDFWSLMSAGAHNDGANVVQPRPPSEGKPQRPGSRQ